jgi:hypothetical protein
MEKTTFQKWKEDAVAYKKTCQNLLLVSPSIRYVGLINEYGRTITGIMKGGKNPLLKAGQVRDEFFLISTLLSMRRVYYSEIGEMEYAIFKHNKVTLLAFQRKEGTYYISIDTKATLNSLAKVIDKIKKML